MQRFEVYWIDQDGHAMMSKEKNKNLVVGKVKMLLDLKLAHPGKEGIMIEVGKLANSEAKIKILTRELEKKHGKLYHAIDVIAESEANVKYWKEVSENNRVDVHKRDNQLAEKDLQLSGLQDTIHSLISEGAEKDKEIIRLRKELDSNSRDFWKAEAERLKKSIDSRRTA